MTLFLEHKNSEPAMKIFMRNIGMTLHVIHKLRAQGIDNVQVNMDWQHLIMNGENLAEYAALLAAEGLLGHQHANSGWGTFDDDNMVGATAFMETLELAIELRRAGYGDNGERARLRPLPLHRGRGRRGQALGAAVALHRRRRREASTAPALREAQQEKDAVRAYELVYAALGCVSALIGLDVGTSGVKGIAIDADGAVLAVAEERYPLSTPRPGLGRAGSRGLVAGRAGVPRAAPRRTDRLLRPDARPRRARRRRRACCGPRSSGTTSARAPSAPRSRRRVGLERLIELTGNRALTGFTAPKLLWLRRHEPESYARIRHILLPKDYVRFRLTGERAIDAADASGTLLFDVAGRRWSEEVCAALELPLEWLPPAHESTEIAGAGDQAAAALGVGHRRPRPRVGRPRHLGRRLRGAARLRARRRRRACTSSATRCPARGTRWA